MDINKANIANALHSVAKEHIVATADEIYDNEREQYQSEVNEGAGRYIENPEFVEVKLDSEERILEAIRVDGTKMLPAGVEINEKIDFEGNETTIIENPEFVEVKLDGAGHILWGIKIDGGIYYGAGIPPQVKDYVDSEIAKATPENYQQVIAFLDGLLGTDTTLQMMLEAQDQKIDAEVQRAAAAEKAINNKIAPISNVLPQSEEEAIVLATDDSKTIASIGAKRVADEDEEMVIQTDDGKTITKIGAKNGDDDNEVMEFKDNAGMDTYAKVGNIDGKKGVFAPGFYDLQGNPIKAFEIDTENEVMIIDGRKYKLIPFIETT